MMNGHFGVGESWVQIFILPFLTVGSWSSDVVSLNLCLSFCKVGVKESMKTTFKSELNDLWVLESRRKGGNLGPEQGESSKGGRRQCHLCQDRLTSHGTDM